MKGIKLEYRAIIKFVLKERCNATTIHQRLVAVILINDFFWWTNLQIRQSLANIMQNLHFSCLTPSNISGFEGQESSFFQEIKQLCRKLPELRQCCRRLYWKMAIRGMPRIKLLRHSNLHDNYCQVFIFGGGQGGILFDHLFGRAMLQETMLKNGHQVHDKN